MRSIGEWFLSECTSLTQPPELPEGLRSIGNGFLAESTSLTEPPKLPEGLVSIGNYFLSRCTSLKQPPKLPDSVQEIGDYFLFECTGIFQTFTELGIEFNPTDNLSRINATREYWKIQIREFFNGLISQQTRLSTLPDEILLELLSEMFGIPTKIVHQILN